VLEVNAPLYYEQRKLGKLTFKRLARFSERWICSHSTWTVLVSNVMKDFLIQEGVPDERLVVIHNGIDPQKFHPGVSGKAIRRKYGLEGKRVIGFVGWFRPWHGVEILLEVMHEANLAKRGVRLLLVGDGPAYPGLLRYVEQYELRSAVVFTGPVRQEEVPEYIAAMDIAVQPSAPEYACPMKIIEYMGMGKCIVAPDQPNIREIIENDVTGYLFKTGDKETLWQILTRLVDNPAKRGATGRKAFNSIFSRGFLWRSNADNIISIILSGGVVRKSAD